MRSESFRRIASWENLLEAFRKAAAGKRARKTAATFEHRVADRLIELQDELQGGTYRPGPYRNFLIHEPKARTISAAPFRDRVVHHALCNVIEPWFEQRFIPDSFANRKGKGTHRAVDRMQQFARCHGYVLRCDVVQHFPSIDHAILLKFLARVIRDNDVMDLIATILANDQPRGLPIGNLTSQFWSNCYLDPFDPFDHFVKRELGCRAYLRYVDDFALFSDSRQQLWAWKRAIIERLVGLRLTIHENAAQVLPVTHGIPWLGFVVFPTHRRVKARNAVKFTRRLRERWAEFCAGEISFAELDASVQGWINHVRYADTWGLRRHVLGRPLVRPH